MSNNYIEYESNGDRNKTLSVEEYLDEIRPYLKDIINNLKNSDTCKEKFVKKNLKTNIFKIKKKKHCKVRDRCHYIWEYRGAEHSIYN